MTATFAIGSSLESGDDALYLGRVALIPRACPFDHLDHEGLHGDTGKRTAAGCSEGGGWQSRARRPINASRQSASQFVAALSMMGAINV
ncbi:MAG: hypothetical protein WAL10_19385, partial [Acetobacteraceae bacterium]